MCLCMYIIFQFIFVFLHTCLHIYRCFADNLQFWQISQPSLHIYIRVYIYIYIHTHIYTYIYMYIYTYMYLRIYTYMYLHIYIYVNIHIHIYIYTCMYVYIYSYVHMHSYKYIHMGAEPHDAASVLKKTLQRKVRSCKYIYVYICEYMCSCTYTWAPPPVMLHQSSVQCSNTKCVYEYIYVYICIYTWAPTPMMLDQSWIKRYLKVHVIYRCCTVVHCGALWCITGGWYTLVRCGALSCTFAVLQCVSTVLQRVYFAVLHCLALCLNMRHTVVTPLTRNIVL